MDGEDHVAVEKCAPGIPASYENLESEDNGDGRGGEADEDEVPGGPAAAKVMLNETCCRRRNRRLGELWTVGQRLRVTYWMEDHGIDVVATEPSTAPASSVPGS